MSGDPTQRRDHSPPAPTSGQGAQDYDGHHYPASSGGHGNRTVDHSMGRPHPLGGKHRWTAQVKATGEMVTLVDARDGFLIGEDGERRFRPAPHGIGVIEVE